MTGLSHGLLQRSQLLRSQPRQRPPGSQPKRLLLFGVFGAVSVQPADGRHAADGKPADSDAIAGLAALARSAHRRLVALDCLMRASTYRTDRSRTWRTLKPTCVGCCERYPNLGRCSCGPIISAWTILWVAGQPGGGVSKTLLCESNCDGPTPGRSRSQRCSRRMSTCLNGGLLPLRNLAAVLPWLLLGLSTSSA